MVIANKPSTGASDDMENMSTEEIMELQKKKCIFCNIVSGKVQSKKVYDDSKCIAILDINPANPGHVLILPKEHYAVMPQMPDDIISHLYLVAKAISAIILKSLKVSGSTIFVANGVFAGQRAQHFMLHVIPRRENDGLDILNIPQKQVSDSDLFEVQKRVIDRVNSLLNVKMEVKGVSKENIPAPKVEVKQEHKKEETVVENVDIPEPKKEKKTVVKKDEDDGIGLDDIARLLK
jgi:histidine triad (HIT) family protein